jgi:enoyl-CoA hydratase/carnithine racemase
VELETMLYDVEGAIATLTFDRPERLNTIVPPMPDELERCVAEANRDPAVKVIVLRGAGRAFCAGFDFADNVSAWSVLLSEDGRKGGRWDPGRDMIGVTSPFTGPVPKFMSLWRSPKPVIAQVHGWCVGGGSDLALCADLVIASDDAQIGTPYARVWGCYLSGMWIYRLGLTKAKEHALTGKPLSGQRAAEIGLINRSVPFAELEATVREQAEELARLPLPQLAAMKLIVNQAFDNMGLGSTQLLGPILDGYMRNIAEAHEFIGLAAEKGVGEAVRRRDAPFADYSQAPPERKPRPENVIRPKRR